MPVSSYYSFTTSDAGKLLGFPLFQSNGDANNWTGATASLMVRDQFGNVQTARPMTFNVADNEWEYSVKAGEFTAARYWAMVAVTFPGGVVVYSTEVYFDVIAAD
jgi:hypothetical protein